MMFLPEGLVGAVAPLPLSFGLTVCSVHHDGLALQEACTMISI
jgi:hypothetical protein